MSVVIYHNPKCTKSRQTLALIEARGIEPKVVEYLKTTPTKAELERILKLLKLEPRALMRCKDQDYKKVKLDNPKLTRAALIKALAEHPILLRRHEPT